MTNKDLKDSKLYQTLYNEMTVGSISKMDAMDGGTLGRHVGRRNHLAENIALAIAIYYPTLDPLFVVKIDQIVKALKYKLAGFASREQTFKAFGLKEDKEATIIEDQNKQTQFVQHVVDLSKPLAQRFYKELTAGENTGGRCAMHGGSRAAKTGVVLPLFLPLALVNFNKNDLAERNFLATNISISVQVQVRQKQDTDTESQVNEGIHATNMLLYSFTTRDSFVDYYQKYGEHFINFISESLMYNDALKEKAVYQLLYNEMTVGSISKMNAMHGGTLGRHTGYRKNLAENMALTITRDCHKETTKDRILKTIVQKLEITLRKFESREQTATAFGWQELWSGHDIINNKTKHTEFVSDIVSVCSLDSCQIGHDVGADLCV
jgi:hypothetical protein